MKKNKCDICGKKFDDNNESYSIKKNNENELNVCSDCFGVFINTFEYVYKKYTNLFPFNKITQARSFSTRNELLIYINSLPFEDETIAINKDREIIVVNKNREFWWIKGAVTCELDLPDFDKTVEEYRRTNWNIKSETKEIPNDVIKIKPKIGITNDMIYDAICSPDKQIKMDGESIALYIKEIGEYGKLGVVAEHISGNTYDIKSFNWLGTFKITFAR